MIVECNSSAEQIFDGHLIKMDLNGIKTLLHCYNISSNAVCISRNRNKHIIYISVINNDV